MTPFIVFFFQDDAITSKKASDWHIYAGDHELKVDETFEQIVKVKNIFLHPEFSLELHQQEKGDWVTARNDIGKFWVLLH